MKQEKEVRFLGSRPRGKKIDPTKQSLAEWFIRVDPSLKPWFQGDFSSTESKREKEKSEPQI